MVLAHLMQRFNIEERGSSVLVEVRGGVTIFLTMSYILLLNPQLLAQAGLPPDAVVVATALSGCLASLLCGCIANLPFGLAPGIGLSSFLVYSLVLGDSFTLNEALSCSLASGFCLCLLAVTGLTRLVMAAIPRCLQLAIVAGMGLLIALTGLVNARIVVPHESTIVSLGPVNRADFWLSLAGLLLISALIIRRVPGAILIGILVISLATWGTHDSFPSRVVILPSSNPFTMSVTDLSVLSSPKMFPAVASFLLVGLVDVGGVAVGMTSLAGLLSDKQEVPGSTAVFVACGLGTVLGGALGSSPVIVVVESAAGIKEGARTGVAAIVVALLFLLAIVFAPLLGSIPVTATSAVAMLIGAMMLGQAAEVEWGDMKQAVPAFLTIAVMPLTCSITNGIIFGLASSACLYLLTGDLFIDAIALWKSKTAKTSQMERTDAESNAENSPDGCPPPLLVQPTPAASTDSAV